MALGRVMIVDDEADVRQSVRLTLRKAGYDVVEAEDGQKAIEAIKSGDNPLMLDAVICDIHMPKVNGEEAIDFLRAQFNSIPILVMTGDPNITRATNLMKQGVVDYLVKPVETGTLFAAVQKAAREHVYRDQFTV